MTVFSLQLPPNVCIASQNTFGIKIKKIQAINMISIKRNPQIIH